MKNFLSTPPGTDMLFRQSLSRTIRFALSLSLMAVLAVTAVACGGGGTYSQPPSGPSGIILVTPQSTSARPISSTSYPGSAILFIATEQGFSGGFTATLGSVPQYCREIGGFRSCRPACDFGIQYESATQFKATGTCGDYGWYGAGGQAVQTIFVKDSLGHSTAAYVR